MRRVTATIPTYWENEFEAALDKAAVDAPEFVRAAVYERVKSFNAPANTSNTVVVADRDQEPDLYMKAAPERLKALSKLETAQVCVRGQEIGEDHIIEPGDLFSWVRFSRDSQLPDWVKNGKLCRECYEIAKEMWTRGEQYF